jgi:uncharacterized membrane protein YhhN
MIKTFIIPILIILTVFFAVACVTLRRKNKSFEGMICKFMASFGFISIAIIGNYIDRVNVRYFSLIIFGLMFGFCGDVFLGIKEIAPTFKKKLIPIGALYFLLGHVFYITAFSSLQGMNWATIGFFIGGTIIAFVLIKILKMQIKSPLVPVFSIYYGLLVWKVGFLIWLITKDSCPANIMALIGSCLFLISDTCLAFLYFTPIKKKNGLVTAELSTYYPAQILLALSVAFR